MSEKLKIDQLLAAIDQEIKEKNAEIERLKTEETNDFAPIELPELLLDLLILEQQRQAVEQGIDPNEVNKEWQKTTLYAELHAKRYEWATAMAANDTLASDELMKDIQHIQKEIKALN